MEEALIIVAAKFLLTFFLSLIFGLERQRSHKPVGFGTFTFVAIGSCALAITALNLYPENPLPLLSAIVTGIGFLGAGALIKTTDKIFGFTSAASVWLFAILGMVIGVGEYTTGMIIYALVWVVIVIDSRLKRRGIGSYQRKLTITTNRIIDEKEIEKEIGKNYKRTLLKVDRKNNRICACYLVEGTKEQIRNIPEKLSREKWLESFEVE